MTVCVYNSGTSTLKSFFSLRLRILEVSFLLLLLTSAIGFCLPLEKGKISLKGA